MTTTSHERELQKKETCSHLDLRLPASGTVSTENVYCLRHPACGALLRRSQQIHSRIHQGQIAKKMRYRLQESGLPVKKTGRLGWTVVKILSSSESAPGLQGSPPPSSQAPGSFFDQASWPALHHPRLGTASASIPVPRSHPPASEGVPCHPEKGEKMGPSKPCQGHTV